MTTKREQSRCLPTVGKLYRIISTKGLYAIRSSKESMQGFPMGRHLKMGTVVMYVGEIGIFHAPSTTVNEGDHDYFEYHTHQILDGDQVLFIAARRLASLHPARKEQEE